MKNYYIAFVLLALLQVNCVVNAQSKRTVHVATAGTLPNLISADEKYEIEELTLTGELNGTDFGFIREMAGYSISLPSRDIIYSETEGKLRSLDITNAKIVKGGGAHNYYLAGSADRFALYTEGDAITPGLFTWTKLACIIHRGFLISDL